MRDKANGSLSLSLPGDASKISVDDTPLTADELAWTEAYVRELEEQEKEHEVLMEACDRVVLAYEEAMAEMEQLDAQEMRGLRFEPQIPFDEWCGDSSDDEEVFKPGQRRGKRSASDASSSNDANAAAAQTASIKGSFMILKEWLYAHQESPYPTQAEKDLLMEETGLSLKQLNNFMINGRRRYLNGGDKKRSKRSGGSGSKRLKRR